MAKKISSSDLFEQEDLFKGVRDSATKTLAVFNELQAELKATAQGLKNELTANTQASTAQLKQFTAVSEEANKLMKQSVEIEKLKAQADQQRIKAETELVKLQKAQAQEAARLAKEQEKAAKNAQNEASAYSKLSKQLNEARKAYKDLAVTNQTNTEEAKDLLNTITKLDKQLKEVDATVGQHQRNVGNYEGATRNLKLELRQLVRELQNMETTDPRFQEMTQRAGELKDQIQDTQAVVKATAGSAMENLAGSMANAGQIGVAAFQGVEASMALFGVESENIQKTLMRLTALMNLSQSLQTFGQLGDKITEISAGFTAFGSKALGAFKALTTAGKAFAVTGIGLITTGLTYTISLFNRMSKEQEYWNKFEQQRQENKKRLIELQKEENQEIATQSAGFVSLIEQLRQTNINSKERKQLIDQINGTYGTTLKNMQSEIDFQAQLNQAVADYITFQTLKLQQRKNEEKINAIIEKQLELSKKAKSALGLTEDAFGEFDMTKFLKGQQAVSQSTLNSIKIQGAFGEELIQKYEEARTEVMLLNDELKSLGAEGLDLNKELNKFTYTAPKTGTVKKELNKIVDLNKQITDEQVKAIEDENQRQQTQTIIEANRRIQDIKATKASKKQKAQLIKEIEQNLVKDLDKLDQEYYDKKQAEEKARIAEEEQIRKEQYDAFVKAEKEKFDLEDEQFLMLQKLRNSAKDQEILEKQLEYEKLFEQAKGNAELELALEEQLRKDIAAISKKYATEETEEQQKKTKAIKENFELSKEYAQQTTDFFKKQSDERIALIDKEISAAEKQAEIYRELAANGNINAEQSLAEQERIIAESNQRKEREMKRQQRMELANTIYQTYAGHAAQDPKTALANTIRDASLLQAFISTLPMFYDGTEDTGAGGGVDGKGGFHAVLHPHERVIPKSLNDQIGNLTNEQLTQIAQQYRNGNLVRQDIAHSSMDLAILVNEMKDLKEVIRNKPETNIELGEITQSAMEIVQQSKRGNTVVYNRFKVRK